MNKWYRFQKKPVIIEAYQIGPEEAEQLIETLEGTMKANPGDWIIQGIEGELYPCKDRIFKQTYELVD